MEHLIEEFMSDWEIKTYKTKEAGEKATEKQLKEKVEKTIVLATSGLIQDLLDYGIDVPEDIADKWGVKIG